MLVVGADVADGDCVYFWAVVAVELVDGLADLVEAGGLGFDCELNFLALFELALPAVVAVDWMLLNAGG